MDRLNTEPDAGAAELRPITPEQVRRVRARIAAVHEDIRRRGVDPTQLPDPVAELVKARDAGTWE
jgi:hypothetical protein